MSSVVNDLGRTHRRAALEEVNAESFAGLSDVLGLNAVLAESCDSALADFVVGNSGYELSVVTVVCEGNSNVSLAAAVANVKLVCLDKLFVVGSGKAEHNLAHSNYFSHR